MVCSFDVFLTVSCEGEWREAGRGDRAAGEGSSSVSVALHYQDELAWLL